MGFVRGRKAVIALGIASAALVSAPSTAVAQHRTFSYAVIAEEFRFRGIPSSLPAGTYDTRLYNIGHAPHVIAAINLGESCGSLSNAELIAVFDQGQEAFGENCPDASFGGEIFALGGGRARDNLTLTPGRNVFVCFVNRHYALGMISSTTVLNIG